MNNIYQIYVTETKDLANPGVRFEQLAFITFKTAMYTAEANLREWLEAQQNKSKHPERFKLSVDWNGHIIVWYENNQVRRTDIRKIPLCEQYSCEKERLAYDKKDKTIKTVKYRAYNIEWDIDEEDGNVSLPSEMDVEVSVFEEDFMDAIAEALTKETGFCVKTFRAVSIK